MGAKAWRNAAVAACAPVGALIAVTVAGCSPQNPPVPAPTGVTVSISQDRLYIARNEASIEIANAGSEPISLTSTSYVTPSLAGEISWSGQLQVPAGSKRAIHFPIPETDCAGDAAATGTARLGFATPAGAASAQFAVTDSYGFLRNHQAAACFAKLLDATASVQLTDVTTKTTDAGLVAVLTVTARVQGSHAIRIDSVKSTTLLQPAGGGWIWEPAMTVDAGGTAAVQLEAGPARCDVHAIAEDKVGTRFDTTVTILAATPVTGRITLVASDAQRGALYDYVVAACGRPAP